MQDLKDVSSGAKVATLVDCYTLVVNKGADAGWKVGMLLGIATKEVTDPDTGESLGFYESLRVKVTAVYPRFCVAETYRLFTDSRSDIEVSVNVGDEVLIRAWPK